MNSTSTHGVTTTETTEGKRMPDYDRILSEYYTAVKDTNTQENPDTPFEDRKYFGLKVRQWKVVAKETAKAATVAYGAVRASERENEKGQR